MENVIEKNQMENGVVDELQEVFVHEEIVVLVLDFIEVNGESYDL